MKELKEFDKVKEYNDLMFLLDKYPFDFVINQLYRACQSVSFDYEREKNYKLADCFDKDAKKLESFLNEIS